jgi:phosphatidylglycerol:prolipoprotein diacylglycerol transferase
MLEFKPRMLPYVHITDLDVLGLRLHPFGVLVATAVVIGMALAKWRARQHGFDLQKLESFIAFMLFVGFAAAHALDEILYRPLQVVERPWSLFFFWEGIGSFSGFIGALVGIVLWRHFELRDALRFGPWKLGFLSVGPIAFSKLVRRKKPLPILPFADLILSVFPIAWIFGRAGCSVAHDHPGSTASAGDWLAVAFPASNPTAIEGPGRHVSLGPITVIEGHFPRYDLGTLELFVAVGIATICVLLWRRHRTTGTYAVIVSLIYAPVRFGLDFLRIESTDIRYARLTPAQWLCIALFLFALVLLRHVAVLRRQRIDPCVDLLAEKV